MSHKNKKNLLQQCIEVFNQMFEPGRSRGADKRQAYVSWKKLSLEEKKAYKNPQEYINKCLSKHIYSYGSFETYVQKTKVFFEYCKQYKCKTLEDCIPYINEFLQKGIDNGWSAYTATTYRSALRKLYPEVDIMPAPVRKRSDITRSRGYAIRDYGFSESRNADYIHFCKATGLRDMNLRKVKGSDLIETSDGYFIQIRGKGGRRSNVPIVGIYADEVVKRMQTAGDSRLFESIPSHGDTHGYRAMYAETVYQMYAKPIEDIKDAKWFNPKTKKFESRIYYCRGDRKGTAFDKAGLYMASLALGHNRIDVVASHYLRR